MRGSGCNSLKITVSSWYYPRAEEQWSGHGHREPTPHLPLAFVVHGSWENEQFLFLEVAEKTVPSGDNLVSVNSNSFHLLNARGI